MCVCLYSGLRQLAGELLRGLEVDGVDAECGGGAAVVEFVVDQQCSLGWEAGDLDGRPVDVGMRLHLVDVAGTDEVVEVLTKVEGIEAVPVEFAALVVEGG